MLTGNREDTIARPPDLRRIDSADFDKTVRPTIDKLAFILNSFMEQTRSAFQGHINFTNLNQQIVTVLVTVDSTGKPLQPTQYKSTLNTQVIGNVCINAVNQTTSGVYPTTAPFINFTINENLVTILNISGLQANAQYQLTVLSIGK